jgi:hypothetical protein
MMQFIKKLICKALKLNIIYNIKCQVICKKVTKEQNTSFHQVIK